MNFLIELINSVINSLNTREIAILFWVIVFLIVIFFIKSTRKAVFDIFKTFFSTKIIIPFVGMILYIYLILHILSYLGLFNINLTKDMVFWFIIGAFPLFIKANEPKKDKNFFKNNALEFIKLTTVFGFFINFYTFNIFIELIFVPLIIVMIALLVVSKSQEKYKPVENLLNFIFLIIVVYLVIFFIYNLWIDPYGFINIDTGIAYILPGILTILLLPYIYLLALYVEYDMIYRLLKLRLNDSKAYKCVFKIFKTYNLDLYRLIAFLSKFRVFKIQDIEDVEKEILKAQQRVKSQNEYHTISTDHNSTYPENKFVSFTKKGNLRIEDKSTDTKLDVMFCNYDELVGEIISATTTEKNIEGMLTLSDESTTIAGQNTATYSDAGAIGAYVFIDDNNKGEKMIINIEFDPAFSTAYNTIINTLIIKQNPSE